MIDFRYQYSLDSFVSFLYRAIERTPASEDVTERCGSLIFTIRLTIFRWVNRGLFERHKLIFCALLTFKLLQRGLLSETYNAGQYQFLLRGPIRTDVENPIADWLPNANW